ncbi:cadherin-87A-like [Plutella xylostella]|uniref:cadherin-87A-like n=1 Tax=Plutella xylostella TaxID=51655 RepID=UPI002032A424|nr:cadherin-87A-like [Plutella xylostella]XP_048489546.1 cadherin-87A-like [Plutella xylostella]
MRNMGADARISAIYLLFIAIPLILAQDCSYFVAVPREDKPEQDNPDFSGTPWSSRPLLPPPDRDDICIGSMSQTGNTVIHNIYMDESIEGDVIIARLNYEDTGTPTIGTFLGQGPRDLLGPVIRRVPELDNAWHLVITQKQDYETPIMRSYIFPISVSGEATSARVQLTIVNIDDNPPFIQALDACFVNELTEAPLLTDCVYDVTDADGYISTGFMTYSLSSDRGDELLFDVDSQEVENDQYRLRMTIKLLQPLNYETNMIHIFSVTAFDSLPNNHTASISVRVQNVESRPPRWQEIWAVQQFDEKTNQSFSVRAIDGDTGLDRPIAYRLEKNETYTFFDIETIGGGKDGAIFTVTGIDRDTLQQEVFQVSIIAYKAHNEAFFTETNVVIIVNDVNDQRPEPLHKEYRTEIREETPLTISFDNDFGFHDQDLGDNARYEVKLKSVSPAGVADAFYIAPGVGYQRQTFTMGTIVHSMLDYEVPEFQSIIVSVTATDLNDPSLVGEATVYIDLVNWNDEEPIFELATYRAAFNETEGQGYVVATVLAKDRDIGDVVKHSLLGNAASYLAIDELTGEVTVAVDNAFDYHRQNELVVQIRAEDTLGEPYHITTTQLVIELYDVNNTPPTIRLPSESPRVEENVPSGFEITRGVTASDPDTTAELHFEIDWDASSATKQGRNADRAEFVECVKIETIYPDEENKGNAIGLIVANEIRPGVTIDFEEFEVLYLSVKVTDKNTVIGDPDDQLMFTIIIIDMNDNPPVWSAGTLDASFRVREVASTGVVIGSVLATDIDGPLYNQIRYSIREREDTPAGLVKIDRLTGQIDVDADQAIDADEPPRPALHYTVIASDECDYEDKEDCPPDDNFFETEGNITIAITDTNNKAPQVLTSDFTVYVWENATNGTDVLALEARDADRDDIYSFIRYQINFAFNNRIRAFFDVELDTGLIFVHFTTDEVLDRDGDEPEHRIFLTAYDNFYSDGDGNRNQQELEVLVVLLDVNDNAPELPPRDQLAWTVSENLDQGIRLVPDIEAPDRDEPNTDNSRVQYEILDLSLVNRDLELPELFTMVNLDNKTGELETTMPLKGFWGTYDIHIRAFDLGVPQQASEETYVLTVAPYNYHAPQFVFPAPGAVLRLARETALAGLELVDGTKLRKVEATDEDGLEAGEVTYSIVGSDEAMEYFTIIPSDGTLLLTSPIQDEVKTFEMTIRATDGGTDPGPLHTDVTFTLLFVPTRADPEFRPNQAEVSFFEKEQGLTETFQLPEAVDLKNEGCTADAGDCYSVYYRIVSDISESFKVDAEKNIISLTRELDRADGVRHIVTVAASNQPDATDNPTNVLTVTVFVREANPRPIFENEVYTAGISTMDSINRELLTVKATHTENLSIKYAIDPSSMVADATLQSVQGSAFDLDADSGVLTLKIKPTASMRGMFEFEVVATDTEQATDRAEVKVYIVSDNNRVSFLFQNQLTQVEQYRDFIAQTLSAGFKMACNIDEVIPSTDAGGSPVEGVTEVRAHFIRDNQPVTADVIEALRSDVELLTNIQRTLNTNLLVLTDFVTDISPSVTADAARVIIYLLGALSAALALACLVLLAAYWFRTRALNRRLEALSTTKFGSMDSGLNRVGNISVPGTNKHAVEGSNPIWNEQIRAPDFDAISEDSDNSDLIGIEDLPQFRYNYFPPSPGQARNAEPKNEQEDELPSHSNHFKFNATPFNQNFGSQKF